MVKFINVSQFYGNFQALYNISFEIPRGTLLALLGPNGAGKSTTMNIITGYQPPLKGDVYINNINIFDNPEEAKKNIGYLPEIPPLYLDLTVREYLIFTGEIHGLEKRISERNAEESIELLKIGNRQDSLIKNLSKGLRQRVGIAQSILHKPKLLILDEPTVGLEPSQLIDFRNLIRDLAENNKTTVILSTHILAEASELCDRIIIIDEGKKIFDGSKDQLLKNNNEFQFLLKVTKCTTELINELNQLKEIMNINRTTEGIEIICSKEIPEIIIERTINLGLGVKALIPIKNSLEKVFLDLTVNKE